MDLANTDKGDCRKSAATPSLLIRVKNIAVYTRNNNKPKYYRSNKIAIEKYWPAQIRNRVVAPLNSPDRPNTSCFHPWMLFKVSPSPDS